MSSREKEIFYRYLSLLKVDKSAECPSKGIYLSRVCNLSLVEFVSARKLYCKMQKHSQQEECTTCLPLIQLANEISEHGLCKVSLLFRKLFSSVKYQSDKAIKRLMQLPVAVFLLELQGPGSQTLFVTELHPGINYLAFSKVAQQFLLLKNVSNKSEVETNMPKESLSLLCNLASSETDRLLIKYTACKSMGLSAKAARALYGFQNFHEQEEKIMDAIETTHSIRNTVTELAKAENTASLRALGIPVLDESESESMDESDSSVSDNDCVEWQSEHGDSEDEIQGEKHGNESCEASLEPSNLQAIPSSDMIHSGSVDPDTMNKSKATDDCMTFAPSFDHMVLILQENELNWFAFVIELKNVIAGYSPESFNQLLIDFAFYLSSSDVTVEEEKLIEESRQAYLETERRQYHTEESADIVSDDESDVVNPDDWLSVTGLDTEAAKEMIVKQRKIYKRKKRTRAVKAVTESRLLRKRLPNRVPNILLKYPNIGDEIEKFVRERKIGADAWRRTGVLTFTYGKTVEGMEPNLDMGQWSSSVWQGTVEDYLPVVTKV